jgi:adenine-specific DNA-methyltransferase
VTSEERLKELLHSLFQLESADLEFGIYRIMNSKRREIEQFINYRLLDTVHEELGLLDNMKHTDLVQTRADVFNDLYTFFSRYYDAGDFMARRRYSSRQPKYAVPFRGEETLFHWTNKDQYYVKTGEKFTDYKFKLPNGYRV